MNKLTDMQKRFVSEYLVDRNGQQAAIRAGYAKKGARSAAYRLQQVPYIAALLQAKTERYQAQLDISVKRILQERARLAFSDPRKLFNQDGSLIPIHQLDDDAAAALQSVEVVEMRSDEGVVPMYTAKIKWADKDKSLTALEKHLGMYKDTEGDSGALSIHLHLS